MRSRRSNSRGCAPTGRRGRCCWTQWLRGPGRALPALSGSPSERGGYQGCCRGRPWLGLQPGVCPGVAARARRGGGCRAACAALTGRAQGWASRVRPCGFSLRALANRHCRRRQVAWSLSSDGVSESGLRTFLLFTKCTPGSESAAVKDRARLGWSRCDHHHDGSGCSGNSNRRLEHWL